MKVYRYVGEGELNQFLRGAFNNTGTTRCYGKNCNNHHYRKDVPYLHFFKDKSSIEFMRYIYRNSANTFYICTFDIPKHLLLFTTGKGFYPTDHFGNLEACREYAIPNSWMRPEYLINYELDEEHLKNMHDFQIPNNLQLTDINFLTSDIEHNNAY